MKIYALTPTGQALARTVNNPDTAAWRAIHYLHFAGSATGEQIAQQIGGEAGGTMAYLARKGIVQEVGAGVEVKR